MYIILLNNYFMYVSIDIGGTHIRVARSSSIYNPKLSNILKVKIKNNYKQDLSDIINLIKKVGGENIEGIGVSIAGRFDNRGRLLVSPNLSSWNNKDFASDLAKVFKCPIKINNDAYASALGEAIYGYGKDKD